MLHVYRNFYVKQLLLDIYGSKFINSGNVGTLLSLIFLLFDISALHCEDIHA